jgi:ABC-type Co2+ transport system permease subunit
MLGAGHNDLVQVLIDPAAVVQAYGLPLILCWLIAGVTGLVFQGRNVFSNEDKRW